MATGRRSNDEENVTFAMMRAGADQLRALLRSESVEFTADQVYRAMRRARTAAVGLTDGTNDRDTGPDAGDVRPTCA